MRSDRRKLHLASCQPQLASASAFQYSPDMITPPPDAAYYFSAIDFNASALLRYRKMLEDFIREDEGRFPFLMDPASPNAQVILFHDAIVRGILPVSLRSSFLVAAWALYESSVLEIASFLAKKLNLRSLSIDRDLGFRAETQTYFRHVLGIERDGDKDEAEHLRVLYKLRNAIAHGGGRAGAIDPKTWKQLTDLGRNRGDFSTEHGYIDPSPDLIYTMSYAVVDAVQRLARRGRKRLAPSTTSGDSETT